MNFYEALSEKSKANWERLYQKYMRKKWEEPTKERVTCETKLEDLEEIAKLMAERPNPTRRG